MVHFLAARPESHPLPFLRNSDSNSAAVVCPYFSPVRACCGSTPSAPTPRRPGRAALPDPGALPDCGAVSGATTADRPAPIGPTCSHRCDHSCACDASTLPGSTRKVVFRNKPAAGVVGTVNRRFKVLWENRFLVFPQHRQFAQRLSAPAISFTLLEIIPA